MKKLTPRARWMVQHYWAMPIILVGLLIFLAIHQWLAAGTWLVWALILIIGERTSRWSFHQGWWMGQTFQASVMASDAPKAKKRQLLRMTMEPWDRMTITTEGDLDEAETEAGQGPDQGK